MFSNSAVLLLSCTAARCAGPASLWILAARPVSARYARPREAMQQSHLQGVFSNRELEASTTLNSPSSEGTFSCSHAGIGPKRPVDRGLGLNGSMRLSV